MILVSSINVDVGSQIATLNAAVEKYEGTQSSSKILINKRPSNKILEFPEWIYFLQALNHYRLSIKGF